MTAIRKKLIEVSMPLEAINEASKRAKKKAPKGYPTSFHKYWAQRPLAACRAVIFGQLVDDPSAWPERFPTKEKQDEERERLHQVIRDFVEWPKSTPADRTRWEKALDAARLEIARSVAWGRGDEPPETRGAILNYLAQHAPPVYDPFCGGGSIPLEAQRLGLRAYGSDLNPVAVLISKALVEIPPKFAGLAPVHPGLDRGLVEKTWQGAEGLAEDVRCYGKWMRDEAERRVGKLYPDATLPDGKKAKVIAWLWARTVRSPDPAAKGAMVPLASSFVLSSKADKESIVRVVRDTTATDGWRFEVQQGGASKVEIDKARDGTQGASGFICVLTGAPISNAYVRSEGQARRMNQRLMAVVAEGARSRLYISPTDEQQMAAEASANFRNSDGRPLADESRATFLSGPTPAKLTGGTCHIYGLDNWGRLFTDRQVVALTTFSDLVGEARARVLADAEQAFALRDLPSESTSLTDDGTGPTAYSDAVATYLAFAVDRMAEYGSTISTWLPKDNAIRSTFARQSLPMVWDFCEANYLAKSSAAIPTCISVVSDALERTPALGFGKITQVNAPDDPYPVTSALISTDPPYYDNIGYADLSDYFYAWMRRSLHTIWPNQFRRLQTPKDEELVAVSYRHGSKEAAEQHFLQGMKRALESLALSTNSNVPLAIYYAFKQSKKSAEGLSSPGWVSFLRAVVGSNLVVDGAWPMRTESEERLVGNNANALDSSIVHVCRRRPQNAPATTLRAFVAELRRALPDALARMRDAGIHPVDITQAALGPGMEVFSKYSLVREPDDSPMTVSKAIALINQVRLEVDHTGSAELDPETRFALDWFEHYGWNENDSGKAIQLAQSYDLTEKGLRDAGVLVTEKGKARLLRRLDMKANWRPSSDRNLTTWELAQAMNRALNEGGGVNAAGALLAEARERGSEVYWLAGRLFAIAEHRKLSDEARSWGRLSEAWSEIEDAADRTETPTTAATQQRLI